MARDNSFSSRLRKKKTEVSNALATSTARSEETTDRVVAMPTPSAPPSTAP